jgi:hypothetical protein
MAQKMALQVSNGVVIGEVLCTSVYDARKTTEALTNQTLAMLWAMLCHLAHHKPAIISEDSLAWLTNTGPGTIKRKCAEAKFKGLIYVKNIKGENFYRLTPRALSLMKILLEGAQERHYV